MANYLHEPACRKFHLAVHNPVWRCGATWWRSWSSKPAWGSTKSQVGSIPIHLRHFQHSPPMKRVPQPPVDPAARALERHDFWPGLAATVAGAALLFCGARHLTSVDTADGGSAWETQLMKA